MDDPNKLNRTVAPEELESFTTAVRRHLPGLNPDPVRLSVFMEGYTDSTRPLVGPLPGCDDIVLLAGFSGQGFKLRDQVAVPISIPAISGPAEAGRRRPSVVRRCGLQWRV